MQQCVYKAWWIPISVKLSKINVQVKFTDAVTATIITHESKGATELNNILGALNIPHIHHKMVANRQAEIGPHIEEVAKDSTEQFR